MTAEEIAVLIRENYGGRIAGHELQALKGAIGYELWVHTQHALTKLAEGLAIDNILSACGKTCSTIVILPRPD